VGNESFSERETVSWFPGGECGVSALYCIAVLDVKSCGWTRIWRRA